MDNGCHVYWHYSYERDAELRLPGQDDALNRIKQPQRTQRLRKG